MKRKVSSARRWRDFERATRAWVTALRELLNSGMADRVIAMRLAELADDVDMFDVNEKLSRLFAVPDVAPSRPDVDWN